MVEASPNPGYKIYAWHGTDDDSSTSTTNTVTMTSDKNVTVVYSNECVLSDAIIILQILSGQNPEHDQLSCYDVNGDGKIGIEEVLYILQKVSGLRQ